MTWLDVKDALRIVDDSGVAEVLEQQMPRSSGRPRVHSWRSILALFVLAALRQEDGAHVIYTQKVWWGLDDQMKTHLGFTREVAHSTIDRYLNDLTAATQEQVHPLTGEVLAPRVSLPAIDLLNMLLRAATAGVAESPAQAIDSMPMMAWARRRGWKRDLAPTESTRRPAGPHGTEPRHQPEKRITSEPGWPKPISEHDYQPTLDPDARDTFRGSKNLEPSGITAGYDLHYSCDVSPLGESDFPQIPRAFHLVRGNADKEQAGLALIDSMQRLGSPLRDVLVDRGYSQIPGWGLQVCKRHIQQSLKLKKSQTGSHGTPIPGAVMIDGRLFVDWMPKRLWTLPNFAPHMTQEETARLCARYNERTPYAFEPKGAPDWGRGVQQYRGPAATKKVRCANHPATLRLPDTKPECPRAKAGKPCACGAQPSLGPDDDLNIRQRYIYGTTTWWANYSRRNSVEGANANAQVHLGSLGSRKAIRIITGLGKRAWMTCFATIAMAVRLIRSRFNKSPSTFAPGEVVTRPIPRPPQRKRNGTKATTLNVRMFGRRKRRHHFPNTQSEPPGPPTQPPEWTINTNTETGQ